MITLKRDLLVKTLCETMVSIATSKAVTDTLFNVCEPPDGRPSTVCKNLAQLLEELGVHDPHIEWFFEIDTGDLESYLGWISQCIANPGPE